MTIRTQEAAFGTPTHDGVDPRSQGRGLDPGDQVVPGEAIANEPMVIGPFRRWSAGLSGGYPPEVVSVS